jgi:hypothetical protein
MRIGRCIVIAGLVATTLGAGCRGPVFVPEQATRDYPLDKHTTDTVDIQVFRDGPWIEVVNSTAQSYHDFELWINQRFVRRVDRMAAGETVRLRLTEFFDERGESVVAGGFFRTRAATPVRLVQIQPDPDEQMIGLISIRAEDIQ